MSDPISGGWNLIRFGAGITAAQVDPRTVGVSIPPTGAPSALYSAQAASVTISDLYTLDPETAVATSVGPTGHAFTAFAFDPTTGIMYGGTSEQDANKRTLYTLDPATGAATLVGIFTGPQGWRVMADLAFESTGQLWGWSGSTGQIHKINKATGAYTSPLPATAIGAPASSIEFDADDVLFYFVYNASGNLLYTVDQASTTGGAPVLVGSITPTADYYTAAMTADQDGLMWWLNSGFGGADVRLRTLDVGTLAWNVVGTSSSDPGDNFDALAWGPG